MKIGLLSDTHSSLEPKVFDHFKQCDEIWHAGDIGSIDVVNDLEKFKPLKAVFGNIDDASIRQRFPEDLWFECENFKIFITHIGGIPPNYNPRVKRLLTEKKPDIFICGHSHILKVMKDLKQNDLLYINPGAAGKHGFHHMKTIVRFDLNNKRISNFEVIELGKRGAIDANDKPGNFQQQ
jgi:putative phosphoesterase